MRTKRWTRVLPLLWLGVCLALLFCYWRSWSTNQLDSDMASEQILAHQLAQEGGILSPNWYYSTELRVVNTQLVMAPLFRLFSSWHTVRVLGSAILFLILLAAYLFFARQMRLPRAGLVGAGVLCLPFCALYRQYVLQGLYYIPHLAFSFGSFGCLLAACRAPKGRRWAWGAGYALLGLLAALGGPRQLFVLQGPLTFAVLALGWAETPRGVPLANRARALLGGAWGWRLALCLAGDLAGLAGYAVNAKWFAANYQFQGQDYIAFGPFDPDRLAALVNALLAAFGWEKGSFFSPTALFNLAAVLWLGFSVVWAVRLARGGAAVPLPHRLLGAFYLAGLCCFVFLYGFTNSGMSDRYVLPLTVFAVPLVETWLPQAKRYFRRQRAVLSLCLAGVLALHGVAQYCTAAAATNTNVDLAAFLVNNGYTQGYASFWDGNILTELSDGRIEVWGLAQNTEPEVRAWLQNTSHTTQPPDGPVFFVISRWEEEGERQPSLPELGAAMPQEALIYEDADHLVYGFASDAAMREACGFPPFGTG